MPVFVLLVFIAALLVWLLASKAFGPIGRFVYRLWKDAKDEMDEEYPD